VKSEILTYLQHPGALPIPSDARAFCFDGLRGGMRPSVSDPSEVGHVQTTRARLPLYPTGACTDARSRGCDGATDHEYRPPMAGPAKTDPSAEDPQSRHQDRSVERGERSECLVPKRRRAPARPALCQSRRALSLRQGRPQRSCVSYVDSPTSWLSGGEPSASTSEAPAGWPFQLSAPEPVKDRSGRRSKAAALRQPPGTSERFPVSHRR
jgi:hypothetical protein